MSASASQTIMRDSGSGRSASPRATARIRIGPGVVLPGSRYRIVGWLGEGANGAVYRAVHLELGREVAVKLLHPERCEDPIVRERFLFEAQTASRIGSPYIAEVQDFLELPDGRLAYFMELVRGGSLSSGLGSPAVPLQRFLVVMRQTCKGLDHAHRAGVLHRDVKPDNILLESSPGPLEVNVKVTDFGTAHMVSDSSVDPAGTPAYLAPEVIAGARVGPSSDVYSLGCTAYELLVGKPPFHDLPVRETLRAQLRSPPPPIDVEQAPEAISRVVMRCLAKDPDERFADMRELEAAWIECQLALGYSTPPDVLEVPEIEDTARRQRLVMQLEDLARRSRHGWRRTLATAGVGLLVVLAIAIGSTWLRPEPDGAPVIQLEAREESEVDRLEARSRDAASRAFFLYPPPEDPDRPTAYSTLIELEDLEEAGAEERARALRAEFADTLVYLGDRFWSREGGRPFALDYYAQALVFDEAQPRARQRGALTHGQLVELRRKAAKRDFSHWELVAAEPLAALADEDEARGRERLSSATKRSGERGRASQASLGRSLEELGESVPEDPVEATLGEPSLPAEPVVDGESVQEPAPLPGGVKKSPEPLPSAAQHRDPELAKELVSEGRGAAQKLDYQRARELFHRALKADRKHGPAMAELSDLAFDDGEYAEAERWAERAVKAAPRRAAYWVRLGDAYVKTLRFEDAKEAYERAVELKSKTAVARLESLGHKLGE